MFDAFIADLHLEAGAPEELAQAIDFLAWAKGRCKRLYILGDLFEYWLGDDSPLPGLALFEQALRELSTAGCSVCIMHGNRDFLLGEAFCHSVGATLIREDAVTITLGQRRALLLHGDTLCSDDSDYQQARNILRSPGWQQQFLSLTPPERRLQAQALRQQSKDNSRQKSEQIMDVNATTVDAAAEQYDVDLIIHGHTHRPCWHKEGNRDRVVVGDWHKNGAEVALYHNQTLVLQHWPFKPPLN